MIAPTRSIAILLQDFSDTNSSDRLHCHIPPETIGMRTSLNHELFK